MILRSFNAFRTVFYFAHEELNAQPVDFLHFCSVEKPEVKSSNKILIIILCHLKQKLFSCKHCDVAKVIG